MLLFSRTLRLLSLLAWTAQGDLVNRSAVALLDSARQPDESRIKTCQYCYRLCPISCFVGTCGNYAFSVRRYETTNQCYSCNPEVSVGINQDGDFLRCSPAESGASSGNLQSRDSGPSGPAVPGDAAAAAAEASESSEAATYFAENAAQASQKAAAAATARYRDMVDSDQAMEQAQAQAHQMATQIQAEEALRVAEATHIAWKAAMAKYNHEMMLLRKQQIVTEEAEKQLEAAEQASEAARKKYANMQAVASHAMEQAMASGDSVASKITSQAAAEELAGAAQAAQRRLVMAAKEAKEAAGKIGIAANMAPCLPVLLQGPAGKDGKRPKGVIGCGSIKEWKEKARQHAAPKVTPLVVGGQKVSTPATPVAAAVVNSHSDDDIDPDDSVGDAVMPGGGALQVPTVEQQFTDNLVEKISKDPSVINDVSTFATPAVPFRADEVPTDGLTALQPAFDASGLAALPQPGTSALSGAALLQGRTRQLRRSKQR